MKYFCCLWLFLLPSFLFAQEKILNIYAWSGEIPDSIIRQFENETGIKVNFSTYENNEIMYAKLRSSKTSAYDLIVPSGYYVDRMRRQNMLEKLDKNKINLWSNINPDFENPTYDPQCQHSVPFIWGVTGIFVNQQYFDPKTLQRWTDLWDERFKNQLMLLEDMREAFSIALLSLGHSINDQNSTHLYAAFLKLKALMKNIKVFSTDTVVSIIIDEDATVGIAWNGDAFKASQDNPNIKFVFPKEGVIIWVENFAIPRTAPHKDAAYAFINFILRADIAKKIALYTSYATANITAQKLLPTNIRNNSTVYPPKEILRRGEYQLDLNDKTLALLEKYWEELKMG